MSHSKLYFKTFTVCNPMPESTLTLCQSRLCPPSQGLWIRLLISSGLLFFIMFLFFIRQYEQLSSINSCISSSTILAARPWADRQWEALYRPRPPIHAQPPYTPPLPDQVPQVQNTAKKKYREEHKGTVGNLFKNLLYRRFQNKCIIKSIFSSHILLFLLFYGMF